ncbi:MAG: tetratricopeptide repeat protein [Bacteroidales bacterium]|nr:tetratricopeptide repeat protein [Bacteroidales bacterium]MBN2764194.1 tetratricopeptide repeat protein [Bacteroidales bacterium]
MKTIIPLLLIFYFIWAPCFSQDNPRISGLLGEADLLIAENQLTEALAKTEEALSISGSNKKAQQYRINIYYLMQNNKEALRYADEALKKDSRNPDFLYLRGIINNSLGKYNKALDDFTDAFKSASNDDYYKLFLNRGVAYFNLFEYDAALEDFNQSIELNDTVASAYHSRAMLNYEMKDYAAAVDDFNKVLKLGQENAAIYFNLGMSYFRLEEKEKACPMLQKSCTMGNKNACRMSLMECVKTIPQIP